MAQRSQVLEAYDELVAFIVNTIEELSQEFPNTMKVSVTIGVRERLVTFYEVGVEIDGMLYYPDKEQIEDLPVNGLIMLGHTLREVLDKKDVFEQKFLWAVRRIVEGVEEPMPWKSVGDTVEKQP